LTPPTTGSGVRQSALSTRCARWTVSSASGVDSEPAFVPEIDTGAERLVTGGREQDRTDVVVRFERPNRVV